MSCVVWSNITRNRKKENGRDKVEESRWRRVKRRISQIGMSWKWINKRTKRGNNEGRLARGAHTERVGTSWGRKPKMEALKNIRSFLDRHPLKNRQRSRSWSLFIRGERTKGIRKLDSSAFVWMSKTGVKTLFGRTAILWTGFQLWIMCDCAFMSWLFSFLEFYSVAISRFVNYLEIVVIFFY